MKVHFNLYSKSFGHVQDFELHRRISCRVSTVGSRVRFVSCDMLPTVGFKQNSILRPSLGSVNSLRIQPSQSTVVAYLKVANTSLRWTAGVGLLTGVYLLIIVIVIIIILHFIKSSVTRFT